MSLDFLLRQPDDTSNPLLPRLYGKGSTKGLSYCKGMEGTRAKFIVFLASGGRYGCDGIDKVLIKGFDYPELDGSSVRQWQFHPGTRSTGYGDALQGRPTFFPELDFVFSGISYLEGLVPEVYSENFDPGDLEIFMRGLKVMHYTADVNGNLVESEPLFSANNSLCGIDNWREVGKLPLTRLSRFGESWLEFEEVCDVSLPWDKDGAGTILNVPRYDCHVPFTSQIDPATAFESIMLRAPGARWQDVSGGIRILPSPDRDSVHRLTFDPTQNAVLSNIVKGSFSVTPQSPDLLPNFFIFSYRDLEDENYKKNYVVIDRPELRDSAGGILNTVGPIDLGLMYESLAQRIGQCYARLAVDPPHTTEFPLRGQLDSYHVAKADNVEITHDVIEVREGSPILARIVAESFEPTLGERSFTARMTTRDFYRDSDHGVKQN